MEKIRRFGKEPNTALLMDRAWGPPTCESLEFDSRQVIEGMDSLA